MNENVYITLQWGAVLGASLAAAWWDIRTTRIPNWLTLSLAVGGLFYSAVSGGTSGVGEGILAWLCLAMPYIFLFLLGQGGAGDAKMMGAIGTWIGLQQGLIVLCCVCAAGGILALLRILIHADRGRIFRNLAISVYLWVIAFASGRRGWNVLRVDPETQTHQQAGQITLPYGVAIFLGVCLGGLAVHTWNIR